MTSNIYYPKFNTTIVPKLDHIVDCPIFGWETEERWIDGPFSPPPDAKKAFNYFRVAGYIPLVNLVAGLALCVFGAYMNLANEEVGVKERGSRLFIRGALTIGFGPALLAIDFAKYKLQQNLLNKRLALGAQRLYV